MSLVLYVFPGDCVISSVITSSYVTLNLEHHHVFGEAPTIFLILRVRRYPHYPSGLKNL